MDAIGKVNKAIRDARDHKSMVLWELQKCHPCDLDSRVWWGDSLAEINDELKRLRRIRTHLVNGWDFPADLGQKALEVLSPDRDY